MSRLLTIAVFFAAAAGGMEIIDRIVGVVGSSVITESQLLRYMRINALLAGKPADLSVSAKRAAAEQLVRQLLVRNEMELGHYPLPAMDDINRALNGFRKEYYTSDAGWKQALAQHDVTEDDVRDAIRLRLNIARFISLRFAPSVNITGEDIEAYYRAHASEMAGRPLEDVRDTIERILQEERVSEALDHWLEEMRETTHVEIREDALQASAPVWGELQLARGCAPVWGELQLARGFQPRSEVCAPVWGELQLARGYQPRSGVCAPVWGELQLARGFQPRSGVCAPVWGELQLARGFQPRSGVCAPVCCRLAACRAPAPAGAWCVALAGQTACPTGTTRRPV